MHPTEDLLRQAYGLRNEGQVESLREMIHAEVVWHARGGDLLGPDEVLGMLEDSDEVAGGTTSREVHALFANDEYGMVLVTIRAQRGDNRFEDRQVHVFRFEDGRVIEFWEYLGDPKAHDEFWS